MADGGGHPPRAGRFRLGKVADWRPGAVLETWLDLCGARAPATRRIPIKQRGDRVIDDPAGERVPAVDLGDVDLAVGGSQRQNRHRCGVCRR